MTSYFKLSFLQDTELVGKGRPSINPTKKIETRKRKLMTFVMTLFTT